MRTPFLIRGAVRRSKEAEVITWAGVPRGITERGRLVQQPRRWKFSIPKRLRLLLVCNFYASRVCSHLGAWLPERGGSDIDEVQSRVCYGRKWRGDFETDSVIAMSAALKGRRKGARVLVVGRLLGDAKPEQPFVAFCEWVVGEKRREAGVGAGARLLATPSSWLTSLALVVGATACPWRFLAEWLVARNEWSRSLGESRLTRESCSTLQARNLFADTGD